MVGKTNAWKIAFLCKQTNLVYRHFHKVVGLSIIQVVGHYYATMEVLLYFDEMQNVNLLISTHSTQALIEIYFQCNISSLFFSSDFSIGITNYHFTKVWKDFFTRFMHFQSLETLIETKLIFPIFAIKKIFSSIFMSQYTHFNSPNLSHILL